MSDPEEKGSWAGADRDSHSREWDVARTQISGVDANLHDLRKYGFTFLTALLAAESILLPYGASTSAGGSGGLPDYVQLGVLFETLLLIFTLHLIDETNLVLQEAAATRPLVQERELNIDLTERITDRELRTNVKARVFLVYFLFAAGVALLGAFTFGSDWYYDIPLVLALAATAWGMVNSRSALKMHFRWESGARDWTVGPLDCYPGDTVRITLTNLQSTQVLGKKYSFWRVPPPASLPPPILLKAHSVVWQIEDENGEVKYRQEVERDLQVYENYTWHWKAEGAGVFRVHPMDRKIPLGRAITIHERPARRR